MRGLPHWRYQGAGVSGNLPDQEGEQFQANINCWSMEYDYILIYLGSFTGGARYGLGENRG